MGAYFVVECVDSKEAEVLLSDSRLSHYLRKQIRGGLLLFDVASEAEVREIIEWMGLVNLSWWLVKDDLPDKTLTQD